MHVYIYSPTRNVMQSGKKRGAHWRLRRPVSGEARYSEPIMGWTGCVDPKEQLSSLSFATAEKAAAYAERMGYSYTIETPKAPAPVIRAYADNFSGGAKW